MSVSQRLASPSLPSWSATEDRLFDAALDLQRRVDSLVQSVANARISSPSRPSDLNAIFTAMLEFIDPLERLGQMSENR